MAISVKKNLVASSKYSVKCPYSMDAKYITFHNTANDASAANEIAYMIRNNNEVSYHFAVDDKEVVQGIPTNRNAWHCGDRNGPGNRSSIGVEVCYSKSGGAKYKAAEKLAIKFIAQLLKERGWGVDRVKKHKEKEYTIEEALNIALKGTGYNYKVDKTGLPSTIKVSNFGDNFSLDLLKTVASEFGAEFDCAGRTIYIAKQIARYTDHQIRHRLNAANPSKEIDTSQLKTFIKGFGKKDEKTGTYAVTAEYTSPLASIYGIRHAAPVRDDKYTEKNKDQLIAQMKKALHDQIDISIISDLHPHKPVERTDIRSVTSTLSDR